MLNIKFHEKLFIGRIVVLLERTDRQTGMTNPIVAFRNFANGPKNTLQTTGNSFVWTTVIIISVLYGSIV